MEHYKDLLLAEKAGEIRNLQVHPVYVLQPKFVKDGKTYRAIKYEADFCYFDIKKNRKVVEDVKGMKTEKFLLKQKMFEYKYLGLKLEII